MSIQILSPNHLKPVPTWCSNLSLLQLKSPHANEPKHPYSLQWRTILDTLLSKHDSHTICHSKIPLFDHLQPLPNAKSLWITPTIRHSNIPCLKTLSKTATMCSSNYLQCPLTPSFLVFHTYYPSPKVIAYLPKALESLPNKAC